MCLKFSGQEEKKRRILSHFGVLPIVGSGFSSKIVVSRRKLSEVIFSQEETRNSGSRLFGENRRRKGEVGIFGSVLKGVGTGPSAVREASRREKTVTATGAVDLTEVAGVSGEGGAEVWQSILGDFSGERQRIATIFGGYLHWFFSFSTVPTTWDLLHRRWTFVEEAVLIGDCKG
ncbi:hypothetical protein U1Q18_001096 [Sarracenia purpurea var. burkii]